MASSFWNTTLSNKQNTTAPLKEFSQFFDTNQNHEEDETEHFSNRVKIQNTSPEDIQELPVDIYETEGKLHIVVPLAGVQSKDLQISVNADILSIYGKRPNPFAEHENQLYSSECFWGKFERQLSLPSSVDTRNMLATFRNGILLIEADRIAPKGERILKIN